MPLPAGLGVPKTRLANGRLERQEKAIDGPWCLCVRGWGCQKGVWSAWRTWGLANGRLECQEKAIDVALVSLPASLGVPKRRLERLEGLRPGKRQAWTPIKSYWWGPGAFACKVRGAKKAFGGFGKFEAWQTAGVNAKKKLLMGPWVGGAKRHLERL